LVKSFNEGYDDDATNTTPDIGPTITLNAPTDSNTTVGSGNYLFHLIGTTFVNPGAIASDVEYGSLTVNVVIKKLVSDDTTLDVDAIDTSVVGSNYKITYSATDS
jgi:hypothetical protein